MSEACLRYTWIRILGATSMICAPWLYSCGEQMWRLRELLPWLKMAGSGPGTCAMFWNWREKVISQWQPGQMERGIFPGEAQFAGRRAVLVSADSSGSWPAR
jgi:hypothetical protein